MASPNHFKSELLKSGVDFENDTIKVALINNNVSYTFDQDNHEFVSDVLDGGNTAEEFGGSGYSRQTLTNTSVTQDDTDDEGVADADDVTFSSINDEEIQGIIIYKQVGADDTSPGDDPILVVFDDDSAGSLSELPLPANGGDVTISFASEGIININ